MLVLRVGLLALVACQANPSRTRGSFAVAGGTHERRLVLVDTPSGRAIAEPGSPSAALARVLDEAMEGSGELGALWTAEPHGPSGAAALFQAASWRLAEAWFNGALSDEAYASLMGELLRGCLDLAREEAARARRMPADFERAPLGWIG
jgi:hypothetical protein